VRQIRIVLAEPPDELRDALLQALAHEPDIAIVADASGDFSVLLEAAHADVVIVGMRQSRLPAIAEHLVDEYPLIGVLAVDIDQGQGLLYQLRPKLTPIDAVNAGSLVSAIRRAAEEIAAPLG
jgi:DNA-binding NarL/FixJ family response regulator